jgi:molecular chaperone GrpE
MDETPINPDTEPIPSEPIDARTDVERERDEFKEGWQRAKADLMNYKRQEADRITSAISLGIGDILEDLLRVMDSFTLALATLEPGTPAEQGVRMIQSQLEDVLTKRGLVSLGIKPGDPFDPATSEALGTMPSTHPEGAIAVVIQQGYSLAGRTLRPARVHLSAPSTQ